MSFTPPGEEPPAPPSPPPPAPPIPGWWLASDGNWYPPQQQPGAAPPPPSPGAPPPYGAPPPTGPPMYAPAPGYGYSPYTASRGTNPFAIASLVLGIVWIWWIGSVLAIVFGFVAHSQIKQTNQGGRGLATAGLILGFIGVGIFVIAVIAIALGGNAEVRFSSVSNSIN